jgi:hypothetical protein
MQRRLNDTETVQTSVFPVASCTECGLASAGRCPTCHRSLCMDHFGLEDHQPCATHISEHAADYVCYVCGAPVVPQQWSTAVFAHYIDSYTCAGCNRYICDTQHTRLRDESVEIARDGLRSHRYHVTLRYCDVCAPLQWVGGLRGASRAAVILLGAGIVAFLVFHGLA